MFWKRDITQDIRTELANYCIFWDTSLRDYKEDIVSKTKEIMEAEENLDIIDALRPAIIATVGWYKLYQEHRDMFYNIVGETPYAYVPMSAAQACDGSYQQNWFDSNASDLYAGGVTPLMENIDLQLVVQSQEFNDNGETVLTCTVEEGCENTLLGLFLQNKPNALYFSWVTGFIITPDSSLENLSETFKVVEHSGLKVNQTTNAANGTILVENKDTGQQFSFEINTEGQARETQRSVEKGETYTN